MTTRLYSAMIALSLSITIFSCGNKDKENTSVTPASTNSVLILGTWEMLYSADDENENGKLDEEEKIFPEDGETFTIYFQSDGTGTTNNKFTDIDGTTDEDIESFSWKLMNDDKELEIIAKYVDSFGSQVITEYDTSTVYISNMTEKSAFWELRYTEIYNNDTVYYKSWTELKKL